MLPFSVSKDNSGPPLPTRPAAMRSVQAQIKFQF